jgi:hypothetical protein
MLQQRPRIIRVVFIDKAITDKQCPTLSPRNKKVHMLASLFSLIKARVCDDESTIDFSSFSIFDANIPAYFSTHKAIPVTGHGSQYF